MFDLEECYVHFTKVFGEPLSVGRFGVFSRLSKKESAF